jgi:hypothetical protein
VHRTRAPAPSRIRHIQFDPYGDQIAVVFAMENKVLVTGLGQSLVLDVAHWHHPLRKTQKTAKNGVTSGGRRGA